MTTVKTGGDTVIADARLGRRRGWSARRRAGWSRRLPGLEALGLPFRETLTRVTLPFACPDLTMLMRLGELGLNVELPARFVGVARDDLFEGCVPGR